MQTTCFIYVMENLVIAFSYDPLERECAQAVLQEARGAEGPIIIEVSPRFTGALPCAKWIAEHWLLDRIAEAVAAEWPEQFQSYLDHVEKNWGRDGSKMGHDVMREHNKELKRRGNFN